MHALKSCKKSTKNSFIPFIQIQPLLIFCSVNFSVTLFLFIFTFMFLFSHKPLVSWRPYRPLLKMVRSVIPKNKDISLMQPRYTDQSQEIDHCDKAVVQSTVLVSLLLVVLVVSPISIFLSWSKI